MSAGVTCNTLLRRRKRSLVIWQSAGSLVQLTANLPLGVRTERKQPWKREMQLCPYSCVLRLHLQSVDARKANFKRYRGKKKKVVNRVLKER